jgi:hypothetical protein
MADAIAILLLLVLFPTALIYIKGCERLKGSRPKA